ncbi:unnamed protein product [Lactuca virosa]|uniref:Uncharacterized protein n=1 Tax=Lactuca virosa TaxID=75947 RepID=A0AAU9N0D2_9ASTR|nr:unnamed protein product [Lactuca virosa]
MEAIEPYLDKSFNGVHGQFLCHGWKRIFHIQEIVYEELLIEFLAMVSFARKDGIYADKNLTFCLGDERGTLSLADFALRTEIYIPSEVHTESYQQYIAGCVRNIEGFKAQLHWNAIANGVYEKGNAQESDIHSPVHRLLHRLITNTINQQQEGDNCPTIDVFFLWVVTSDNTHVDLPFLLADFLAVRAGKDRRGSPSYGDMLITRLSHSYGILDKHEAMMLTVKPQNPFSTLLYKRANIVVDHGFGNFGIPDDTPRGQVPRRVRPRGNVPEGEEPPVVPEVDEMPMDPYSVARRRFEDNLARSGNYTKMGIDYLMEQLHFPRLAHFPPTYPYEPTWDKLWKEQQGGAGGSGDGGDDEEY